MKGKTDLFSKKGRGYKGFAARSLCGRDTVGRNRRLMEYTVGHGQLYKITKVSKLK
jgi:hypothetical protein